MDLFNSLSPVVRTDLVTVACTFVVGWLITNVLVTDSMARALYNPPAKAAKPEAAQLPAKPEKSEAAQLLEVRSRVTSTLNAWVTTYVGVCCLAKYYNALFDSPSAALWGEYDALAHFGTSVLLGYIMSDTLTGLLNPGLLDALAYIHHVLVIISFGAVLVLNFGTNVAAIVLINEGSTTFVNIHFLGNFSDWRKAANGALMFFSYLFCRMVLNIFMATHFFSSAGMSPLAGQLTSPLPNFVPVLFWFYLAIFIGGNCLNIIWFNKIARGFIKAVSGLLCSKKAAAGDKEKKL